MPITVTSKVSANAGNTAKFGSDGGLYVPPGVFGIKVVDDATVLTSGTGKFVLVVPSMYAGMKLYSAEATISTASTSGTVVVTVRGVTPAIANMFSNTLQLPPPVLSTASSGGNLVGGANVVQSGNVISIDVTSAGTGAKGLAVYLGFRA